MLYHSTKISAHLTSIHLVDEIPGGPGDYYFRSNTANSAGSTTTCGEDDSGGREQDLSQLREVWPGKLLFWEE
jgi:hypothetical protein